MHPIATELLTVTGLKKLKSGQAGLIELVEKVNGLPSDNVAWNSLSPEAQEWANVAIEAKDDDEEIPDFPKEIKAKSSKPAVPPKAPKKAPPKKAPPAKTKPKSFAAKAPRVESAQGLIREKIIDNPKITSKEMEAILAKKGVEVSPITVSSIISGSGDLLRRLNRRGKLKGMKL